MSDYAGEFVHFVSIVQRRIVFATFRLSGILLMILTLIGSDGCVHKECLCSGSNSVSLCSVCTSHLVPPLTAFVNVSAALLVLAEGELFISFLFAAQSPRWCQALPQESCAVC